MRVTVATRRSALALAQSRAVAVALEDAGHEASLLEMTTTGDRWSLAGSQAQPGMDVKGMFVKELEEALLDGRADIAAFNAARSAAASASDSARVTAGGAAARTTGAPRTGRGWVGPGAGRAASGARAGASRTARRSAGLSISASSAPQSHCSARAAARAVLSCSMSHISARCGVPRNPRLRYMSKSAPDPRRWHHRSGESVAQIRPDHDP